MLIGYPNPLLRHMLVDLSEMALPGSEIVAVQRIAESGGGTQAELTVTTIDQLELVRAGETVALIEGDDQLALSALRHGATAVASERDSEGELLEIIRAAGHGVTAVSSTLRPSVIAFLPEHALPVLSEVEISILRSIARGETVTAIADRIAFSRRTTDRLIAGIKEKLEAPTRSDLIRLALATGLSSQPAEHDSGIEA